MTHVLLHYEKLYLRSFSYLTVATLWRQRTRTISKSARTVIDTKLKRSIYLKGVPSNDDRLAISILSSIIKGHRKMRRNKIFIEDHDKLDYVNKVTSSSSSSLSSSSIPSSSSSLNITPFCRHRNHSQANTLETVLNNSLGGYGRVCNSVIKKLFLVGTTPLAPLC